MPDLGLSISRILVPVDFSDRCLGMMPYVKAFSERYSAEVLLLHVVDPVYTIPATGISPPAMIPTPQWLFDQRARQLETFAAADLTGLPVRRLIYEGDPESQIAATAQSPQEGSNRYRKGAFWEFAKTSRLVRTFPGGKVFRSIPNPWEIR